MNGSHNLKKNYNTYYMEEIYQNDYGVSYRNFDKTNKENEVWDNE